MLPFLEKRNRVWETRKGWSCYQYGDRISSLQSDEEASGRAASAAAPDTVARRDLTRRGAAPDQAGRRLPRPRAGQQRVDGGDEGAREIAAAAVVSLGARAALHDAHRPRRRRDSCAACFCEQAAYALYPRLSFPSSSFPSSSSLARLSSRRSSLSSPSSLSLLLSPLHHHHYDQPLVLLLLLVLLVFTSFTSLSYPLSSSSYLPPPPRSKAQGISLQNLVDLYLPGNDYVGEYNYSTWLYLCFLIRMMI